MSDSEMFDLDGFVQDFFLHGVNEAHFSMGIDYTGVYLFTYDTDAANVRMHAEELRSALALNSKEVMIIIVDDDVAPRDGAVNGANDGVPNLFFVKQPDLISFVRYKTGQRNRVFSAADIASILDCFSNGDDKEEDDVSRRLKHFGLSDDTIQALMKCRPMNTQEVRMCGVREEISGDVFDVLSSVYPHNRQQDQCVEDYTVLFRAMRFRSLCSMGLLFCAVPFFVYGVWAGAFLLVIVALAVIFPIRKKHAAYLADTCMTFGIVQIVLILAQVGIPYFIVFLQERGFL